MLAVHPQLPRVGPGASSTAGTSGEYLHIAIKRFAPSRVIIDASHHKYYRMNAVGHFHEEVDFG